MWQCATSYNNFKMCYNHSFYLYTYLYTRKWNIRTESRAQGPGRSLRYFCQFHAHTRNAHLHNSRGLVLFPIFCFWFPGVCSSLHNSYLCCSLLRGAVSLPTSFPAHSVLYQQMLLQLFPSSDLLYHPHCYAIPSPQF